MVCFFRLQQFVHHAAFGKMGSVQTNARAIDAHLAGFPKRAFSLPGSRPFDFREVARFTAGKTNGEVSDLFRLSDAQMARLEAGLPKSHGKPRVDDRRDLSQGPPKGDRHGRLIGRTKGGVNTKSHAICHRKGARLTRS